MIKLRNSFTLPKVGLLSMFAAILCWGTVSTAWAQNSRTPKSYTPNADAGIRAKINELYNKATQMNLDGKAEDWAGFLELKDLQKDAGGDPSRDLVSIAIAPMPHELRVMIRTRGKPTRDPFAYYVWLDVQGSYESDLLVEYDRSDGALAMRYVSVDRQGNRTLSSVKMMRNSRVAIDEVVEFVIRYEDLVRGMPTEWRKDFQDPNVRPWIRAWSYAFNPRIGEKGKYVDRGPTVASYRLQRQAYRLDPVLSHAGLSSVVVVGLPLRGQWFINQGPFTQRTHQQQWAYDFIIVDQGLRPSQMPGDKIPTDPSKYYGWNQSVIAPTKARIISIKDGNQDHQITGQLQMSAGNSVFLGLDAEIGLYFDHLKLNSVMVTPRQAVLPGDELGRVGNSGRSLGPHLHLAAQNRKNTRITYPIALMNVLVGLNPVANDPWARRASRWTIREGYFVRRLKDGEDTPD